MTVTQLCRVGEVRAADLGEVRNDSSGEEQRGGRPGLGDPAHTTEGTCRAKLLARKISKEGFAVW